MESTGTLVTNDSMEPKGGNSHLIFNVDPKMLAPLFTKCDNKTTRSKEKTTAQPFLGKWPRYRHLLAMLLATEADHNSSAAFWQVSRKQGRVVVLD